MADSMTFNEFSTMSGYAYTGVRIADYLADQKGVAFSADNLTAILAHNKDMCVIQGGRTGIVIRVMDRERRKQVIAGTAIGDWGGWKTNSDKVVQIAPGVTRTFTLSETGTGYDHDVLITLLQINPEKLVASPKTDTTPPISTQTTISVSQEKAGGDGAMYEYHVITTDVDGITKTVFTTAKQADALATFANMDSKKNLTQVQLMENGRIIKTGSGGYTPPDRVGAVMNSDVVSPENRGVDSPVLAPPEASSPTMAMPGIDTMAMGGKVVATTVQENWKALGILAALGAFGAIAYAYLRK